MNNAEKWIGPALADIQKRDLKRQLATFPDSGGKIEINGWPVLNFSSNDYLGLAHHPEVLAGARKALNRYGTGAGASRLVCGTLPPHEKLEAMTAHHKGYPAALVFGSGFLANAGIIPALAGRNDIIFADKLVHASIIDAALLSRARIVRYQHNDINHLTDLLAAHKEAAGRRLIVTESVFSMDGDLAPLTKIAALARDHEALLIIDEAHAGGVFGPSGSGLVHLHGLQNQVNIAMGTFSKAFGNYGGFATCSEVMREWLVNRARSFIYTTALPPSVMGGCLAALKVLECEPDLGKQLQSRATLFRRKLQKHGFDTGQSQSQIIPVMIGDSRQALKMSAKLRQQGIIAIAIRPPTVPENSARLRFSVTLEHSEEDLNRAADILGRI